MIARIFGHYVATEMFFLWLLESTLCFLVFYVLLTAGTDTAALHPPAIAVDLGAANHAALLVLAIGIASIALGLYRPEICLQTRRLALNTVAAGLLAFPAILVIGRTLDLDIGRLVGHDDLWPAKILLAWLASLLVSRAAFSCAMRLDLLTRPILVIGSDEDAARTGRAIAGHLRGFFRLAGVVPGRDAAAARSAPLIPPALLRRRLGGSCLWGVVVTEAARAHIPADELQALDRSGIRVFGDIEFRERQLRRIDLDALDPDWLRTARALAPNRLEAAFRRTADLAISLCFLVATLPLMLLAALLIKLDSAGPVFYRQERAGLHGRPFTLYKFRSMFTDAEARGPTWAVAKDPRITRVGAFIRLTRIDELPQLVNVLRGEMGFIGPRPERPHFIEQLADAIPHYRDRAHVKPGITGWAQVSFRYGASIEDARTKLAYDLYYVKHRTLFLDLLILFATVRVILFQEGAR